MMDSFYTKKTKEDDGADITQKHKKALDCLYLFNWLKYAKSWLDNKLIDIACSKHNVLIIAAILSIAVLMGVSIKCH